MHEPMKLTAPLKDYLWGGTRLRDEYGKHTELPKVAESWELACHRDGKSVIASGASAGETLEAWLAHEGAKVLGTRAAQFPYFPLLIKLIDAHDNLSVQVHPSDEYALRVEGEYGKTELWYVVDAAPGAEILYGFAHKISKGEFRQRIKDNTLLEVVRHVPAKKGDAFFIPAGTLHAIGKGLLICEIQQSSNATYRVYDYGRVGADGKPRGLHIDKALDVTSLIPVSARAEQLPAADAFTGAEVRLLAACPYFTAYHLRIGHCCSCEAETDSFHCLTILAGAFALTWADGELSAAKGESVFVPANFGRYTLRGAGELILSKV